MGVLKFPRWGQDARQDRQLVTSHLGSLALMAGRHQAWLRSLSNLQRFDEASTQQLTGVLAARACDHCDASIGESGDSSCLAGVLCSIGQPHSHCSVEGW